jgi:TonB-dependent receptor
MLLRLKLLLICSFALSFSFAQNKISGKISNEKNEPIGGVSVKVAGRPTGGSSDVEGRYSLNLPAGKYELEFSAIGYETKTVTDVEVTSQLSELNVVLVIKAKEGENVVVTGRRSSARMESVNASISFLKNTNTVASIISAESIRRSPDRNTGEVLKRTPGASLQDGKFLVVRGLADRYNQAMLNGILLSSTEPDRKTFSFDLIPASMIDNIIINKAFVPEYPGEWAGGLIQVNTRDIPAKGFLNVQVGTGFNTQTIGKDFYKQNGGNLDWLGINDGTRSLPAGYTTKSNFDILSAAEKTEIGKSMRNDWTPRQVNAPLNASFQANAGFNTTMFGKKVGGTFGLIYNKTNRFVDARNSQNSLQSNNVFFTDYDYNDDRYVQDVMVGALGGISVQLNSRHKISAKSMINVNTDNYVINRSGNDYIRNNDVRSNELTFKQNTFFSSQLIGEHTLATPLKLKWYGSFNILDGQSPDQRRIAYTRTTGTQTPFSLLIGNSLSQESGSRIFQDLSDYIYTAGGDLTYSFNWLGQKQTLKGGYMLQIKDRLYDAKLFANQLPVDNVPLRALPADQVFAPENFGNGVDNKFAFDAIKGNTFRYLANTILNAGFLQLDNQFTPSLRVVWGLRVENYDQLVGSVKKWDPRHTYSEVLDFLPGLNATLKLNDKTNLRLSGSQTVIRPELRELAALNLYDFELNASIQGNPSLKRTKVTNADFRYEYYPRAGEVFSAGVFYKYFKDPIEQFFTLGSGGASTFNFQNPEKAQSYGAEVEFRKKLDFANALRNFTFQANAAYIYSRVKDESVNLAIDRPMQGQSPYLINLGLMYDLEKQGLNATILFNQIGERIYLVGDISAGAGAPDVYEAPRPVMDFQIAKKIIKNKGELRLNVSDILNQTQYFYQNADGNKRTFQKAVDAYRFTRRFGTTFSLTFNYSII